MPASSFLPNTFTSAYDPTTNYLQGYWSTSVDSQSLRMHYTNLLAEASAAGNCCYWLLDVRGRNWHTPELGYWFGGVFAAAAHQTLHQPLFIAYVLGPEHQRIANAPGVQAMQRACAVHSVYPFYFDNKEAAREWLAHQQAHDN